MGKRAKQPDSNGGVTGTTKVRLPPNTTALAPLAAIDTNITDNDMTEFITLNVGGTRFVTTKATLNRVPNTRLSDLSEDHSSYDKTTGEYFFDRNPSLFNYILDYYRTSEFHFPHNFCGPFVKKELMYWRIEEYDISPCCWHRYREFEEKEKIFGNIERAFETRVMNQNNTFTAEDLVNASRWQVWKRRIWTFLEEPMSSRPAQVWTVMFLLVVLVSIGILCMESHPISRVPINTNGTGVHNQITLPPFPVMSQNRSIFNSSYNVDNVLVRAKMAMPSASPDPDLADDNPKIYQLFHTQLHPALEHIDSFCACFFTAEFLLRLLVAPDRKKFFKSFMNIIDILCVMPMWIKYILQIYDLTFAENTELLPVFFVMMMLRVLRICRVLRMARHYVGVKILMLALKASLRELTMLLIFVFIVILIFAVVIYYAEFFVKDTFPTIPHGYWWAIITITTVGYGDMYPKSVLGYMVGALCALTGILATGLPVPIIASNFNLYYSHAQLQASVMNRKRVNRRDSSITSGISNDQRGEPLIVREASV